MLEKDINMKGEFLDVWEQQVPKVLDLCGNSESKRLNDFLATYTYDKVSDGKLTN